MARTMREHLGSAAQRSLLIAAACAIALATFTSILAIVEFHDHDCAGDDCPTCLLLDAAQAMIGSAATPAAHTAAIGAAIAAFAVALAAWALPLAAKTPVSEKVLLLI